MSERKVLNKYFPPDFDPSKIPRRKIAKDRQETVRLMAPFSMRCNSCGEYIYKGKKFNARKETAQGEEYYGIKASITFAVVSLLLGERPLKTKLTYVFPTRSRFANDQVFRFYIKCTLCSSEITFKTDPKNADYIAEHGASRNFESWRDDAAEASSRKYMPDAADDDEVDEETGKLKKQEEDAMQMLEDSTENSKREMDILDALQDIRSRNSRNERVGLTLTAPTDRPLALTPEEIQRRTEAEEDEKLVRAVFDRVAVPSFPPAEAKGKGKAIDLESGTASDEEDEEEAEKTVTIKRKLDTLHNIGAPEEEPSLSTLLSQKGLASKPAGAGGFGFSKAVVPKPALVPKSGSGPLAGLKRKAGTALPGVVLKKKA